MIAAGVVSALSVSAAAPSKVPFYVAGAVLALWAVVLAVFGITRPGFPGSKGGRRGVLAVSALLVAAAMSTAIATAGEETEGTEGEATASTGEFDLAADPSGSTAFDKTEGTVKAGAVTIHLVNESPLGHNVAVAQGDKELGRSKTITRAETDLKVDLKPGEYDFYCTVTGHRAAGMEGKLTVR
jgi:plastocyanin